MDPVQYEQIRYYMTLPPSPVPLHMTGAQLPRQTWKDFPLEKVPEIMAVMDATPETYSLEQHVMGTYNQGARPSCVAESTAGMKSIEEHMDHGQWFTFDATDLYVANGGNGSNGVDTRQVLTYCQEKGARLLNETRRYRIADFAFAPRDPAAFVQTTKAAVFAGKPCVLALLLPANFSWDSSGGPTQGYHQVVVYGYDSLWFYILNSWGGTWGRGGKGRIPIAYVTQQDFLHGYNYLATATDTRDDGLPPPPPPPPPDPNDATRLVLTLTNSQRQMSGVPALAVEPRLQAAAQAHSQDMATANFYAHENLKGQGPLERMVLAGLPNNVKWGENIAAGVPDAATVVSEWVASPGHRQNLLDPAFTHIGIGKGHGDGSQWKDYWTQDFMSLGGNVTPPPPVGLTVSSVVWPHEVGKIRLGETVTVRGSGFAAGVIQARIDGSPCGVRSQSDTELLVTPLALGAGTLYVRREGVEVAGPPVAVVDGRVDPPGPPNPPPPPPVGELSIDVYAKRVFRGRLACYVTVKLGSSYVAATVTANVSGLQPTTAVTTPQGATAVPAIFVLVVGSGQPIRFVAASGGNSGERTFNAPGAAA